MDERVMQFLRLSNVFLRHNRLSDQRTRASKVVSSLVPFRAVHYSVTPLGTSAFTRTVIPIPKHSINSSHLLVL